MSQYHELWCHSKSCPKSICTCRDESTPLSWVAAKKKEWEDVPMGASQWLNHGKKYGYYEYFHSLQPQGEEK